MNVSIEVQYSPGIVYHAAHIGFVSSHDAPDAGGAGLCHVGAQTGVVGATHVGVGTTGVPLPPTGTGVIQVVAGVPLPPTVTGTGVIQVVDGTTGVIQDVG